MATKTWTEPLVLGLMAETGRSDPREAIEEYAEQLLLDARQDSFPINVEMIASLNGVRSRRANHNLAGRIYAEDDCQLVRGLNASDPSSRQRFRCAHELMRTAFPSFIEEQRYRSDTTVESHPVNQEEEYLCDLGAAALLMPSSLVVGRFSLTSGGLLDVERLAHQADVGLEAAGNRLAELSAAPVAFMVFEYSHKPADRPALRRGDAVPKRVRLRYAHCSGLDVFLPRFKGADDSSVIAIARSTGEKEGGIEELPGVRAGGLFRVEAKRYDWGDTERVLAVAQPK